MLISLLQLPVDPSEDPAARVERVCARIRAEASAGVGLVVLPELWSVGYFDFDAYEHAVQPLDGPFVERLATTARSCGVVLHLGSFLEADGSRIHNTSVLLSEEGTVLGTYRKIHLFGAGSREPMLVTPGTQPCVVDVDGLHIGMAICYDLRFPDLFAALARVRDRGDAGGGGVSAPRSARASRSTPGPVAEAPDR